MELFVKLWKKTGIIVEQSELQKMEHINSRATYFYVQRRESEIEPQTKKMDNDANGIGWIKPRCLDQLILNGVLSINNQCRIMFRRIMCMDMK